MKKLFLVAPLMLAGCAFFGTETVDCLDGDCSRGGDGDAPGDGDQIASGGFGDGDGDLGDGDGRGGTGAGSSSGGTSSGSSGGTSSGGSTGVGGSGGLATGGSSSTGGTGTGGVVDVDAEIERLAAELQINEMNYTYLEIYFIGAEETSMSLDNLGVAINGLQSNPCPLIGLTVTTESRHALAQSSSSTCLGNVPNCAKGCDVIDMDPGDTAQLLAFLNGEWHVVDDEMTYHTDFDLGESFAANPEGKDNFETLPLTPGGPNL